MLGFGPSYSRGLKVPVIFIIYCHNNRPCFHQTRSAWSLDQGLNKNDSFQQFCPYSYKFLCNAGTAHHIPRPSHMSLNFVTVRAQLQTAGPLLLTWINFDICNYIHYKVWNEINYPFLNFNGDTIEVWEWINNFIPHFARHVITYPCWDWY